MRKQITFVASAIFVLTSVLTVQAQKTDAELKAEREQIKTELKSAAEKERQEKINKLNAPSSSGVKSVDDLAVSSAAMVLATNDNNKLIPELYKRTLGESIDGVADVTVKKPKLEELTAVSANIATQIAAVSKATEGVKAASEDVTKAGPLKAGKASKALNYSKEALALLGPELQLNAKVVNHLIETVKTSKNY